MDQSPFRMMPQVGNAPAPWTLNPSELVEQDGITLAPHVGRYQWVSLERLDGLSDVELKELMRESYGMVAAKTKIKGTNRPARKARRAGKGK